MALHQANIAEQHWRKIKMKKIIGLATGGLVLLFVACGPQTPQRPSQRKGESPQADSTAMSLLELNQQLAISADNQLIKYVQAQEETYALYNACTWMRIIKRGNEGGATPKHGDSWIIHMRTYNLKGHLLIDSEGLYTIGKHEIPMGVELNIEELHHGGEARLIVPWYSAYGQRGTEHVPPYENVIIEIELK